MQIKLSTQKWKKYMALIDGTWIHFGDKRYQHYRDSTPLRHYHALDHGDAARRQGYFLRHSGYRSKYKSIANELLKSRGRITAKILSHKYLW